MTIKSQRLDNMMDTQYEPIYDSSVIKSGEVVTRKNIRLFAVPQGGQLENGVVKTYADTNMKAASQLPTPEAFRCYGIKMEAFGLGVAESLFLQRLLKDASISIKVGNKPYFTAPLEEVMGGVETFACGLDPALNSGEGLVRLQTGKQNHHGYRFPVDKYIDIVATENFSVEIDIETESFTMPSDFYFRVYLLGIRGKEVR